MTAIHTWFVTGASRGIGLELVRQLSALPANVVIAACRSPDSASTLQSLKNSAKGSLHIVQLDISDESSIRAVATSVQEILSSQGLDYLINNAAIMDGGDDRAFSFSPAVFMRTLEVNVLGPALVSQVLLPFLERGNRKVLANVTSGLASIGLDFGAKNATYSISKTALNMLTYKQSTERPDLIAFILDPGWVKTDMGGPAAALEPHQSVSSILNWVTTATSERSGKFFNNKGEPISW